MPLTARRLAPTGSVSPFLIPKHGFYAPRDGNGPTVLPKGLPLNRRLATLNQEIALRFRVAGKGLYRGLTKAEGVIGVGRLYATVIRADGRVEHLGLVSTRVITDAGVARLVDSWDGGDNFDNYNYHGCGTGTTAEAVGDTALVTESTTALSSDSTRATGTKSQPAANQMRSVGTLTFDASAAVTEHGLFDQAATGGGSLWDRSVFSAVNVVSGDSIQFTYTATFSSGG